jgi:exosortase
VGAYLPLIIAAVAAAGLYGSVVGGLAVQWVTDSDSSHGILLVLAAAWLLRRRWAALRDLPAAPANAGFAILGLALLIYLAGTLTGDIFILRVSMPIALAGCVLALFGFRHARVALAPMILLAIAIPLPMVIVTTLTMPLQLIASQVAAEVLNASGVFVAREGNLLILRDITLEVAEACSGLRSLVSLVTVSAVCAAGMSLPPGRALLMVATAVPVAVVGNGFRVAATGFLATWFGDIAVHGVVHELTGFVAFLGMLATVVGVQMLTRRRPPAAPASPLPALPTTPLAVSR